MTCRADFFCSTANPENQHSNADDKFFDLEMTNDQINVPWKRAQGSRGYEIWWEKALSLSTCCPILCSVARHRSWHKQYSLNTNFPSHHYLPGSVYGNGVPQYRLKVQLAESDHSYPCTMQQSTQLLATSTSHQEEEKWLMNSLTPFHGNCNISEYSCHWCHHGGNTIQRV